MVTYNNPWAAQLADGLVKLFAPPAPQEMAALTQMQLARERGNREGWLFNNPNDPTASRRSALVGIQGFGNTPEGFGMADATDRYGYDKQAETARANNANTVKGAAISDLFGALPEGSIRPALPANVAETIGLPEIAPAAGSPKLPETAQQYTFGQQNPGYFEWLRENGGVAGGTEYGTTPIWGQDAQGNVVILQAGKNGTVVKSQMPEGVTIDFNTKPFETARGTELGKQAGDAAATAGAAEDKTQTAVSLIDSIITDKALPGITGMFQGRLPPMTQAGTDLNAKIDQLTGQAFLEAFNTLRGGGQITEIEGRKATDAMARLNRAQSPEAYIQALNDMKDVLLSGMARRQQKAMMGPSGGIGGPQPPQPPQPPASSAPPTPAGPQPGTVMDGYRFLGGDPSNPASWEAVR